MSDINLEQQRQEKMESLFWALIRNVGCTGIGWVIFCIAALGLNYYLNFGSPITGILMLVGAVLVGAPLLINWFSNRSITGLFRMPEYEVITTTYDGVGNVVNKQSDGGLESATINLGLTILIAGIMLLLAFILQPIRIIIMGIKYAFFYIKAQRKPPFIKTGFFIVIIGVAFFILGIVFGSIIQKAGFAKVNREYNTALEAAGIDPNAA